MELINYFKFRSIYETLIKDRLLPIFNNRWLLIESYGTGVDATALAKLLPPSIKNDKIRKYINDNDGKIYRLDYKSLVTIILNVNFNKLNSNDEITNQNEIIKSINDYFNEFSNSGKCCTSPHNRQKQQQCIIINTPYYHLIVFKDDEELNESIKFISESIKKLDKSTGRINDIDIEAEIKNKINSDIKNSSTSSNENKVIEMNEKGMNEFNEKNYNNAKEYFKNALQIDGISDCIKAELSFNLSNTLFEIAILDDGNNDESFKLLEYSRQYIKNTIRLRPNWALAYLKCGIIHSKLGDFSYTIELFNSALILDENLKIQIDELIKISKCEDEAVYLTTTSIEIDRTLTQQPIDFNQIKEISENNQNKSNLYAKRIYSNYYLKVLKFIKSFKALDMKKSKLKDKFEVIKILASLYRDSYYDSFIFIRIPSEIINETKELVKQLLLSSPSNIDNRICWLALSRYNNITDSSSSSSSSLLFEFIQESINNCKNEKDYLIFKYYQIIYQGYKNEFNNQFNNLINLLNDNQQQQQQQQQHQQPFKLKEPIDKDYFTYLLLSIINNNNIQNLEITNQHLNLIISNVDSFNSRLIKGNPQNSEINFNLYLLLSKLNNNSVDASKYLEIGKSELNYLIPQLKSLNLRLDQLLPLIKNL